MNCHTLLGNGAYYAPDLTKSLLDQHGDQIPGSYLGMTNSTTKEEAMSKFYKIHLNTQHMTQNLVLQKRSHGACSIFKRYVTN